MFTVTASKGYDGGQAWSQLRTSNASCVVMRTADEIPHVSIIPKVAGFTPSTAARKGAFFCLRADQHLVIGRCAKPHGSSIDLLRILTAVP